MTEWVKVDLAVVEKHGADAAVLLGLIAYRCHPTGSWQASTDEMASASGLTVHRVRAALRSLRDTGEVEGRRADRFHSLLTWSVSPGHAENAKNHFTGSGDTTSPVMSKFHVSTVLEEVEEETPTTLRAVADPAPRPDVEALCQRLADRIEANGSKRPTVTTAWRTSCRLLIDRDERTPAQVARAIDWSQNDSFWRSNIMSMPTLRKQYDRLRLAAERQRDASGYAATPAVLPPPRPSEMYG